MHPESGTLSMSEAGRKLWTPFMKLEARFYAQVSSNDASEQKLAGEVDIINRRFMNELIFISKFTDRLCSVCDSSSRR